MGPWPDITPIFTVAFVAVGIVAGGFVGWLASLFGFWWTVPLGASIGAVAGFIWFERLR